MSPKARYCVIAAHKQIPDFSPKYGKKDHMFLMTICVKYNFLIFVEENLSLVPKLKEVK